MTISMEDLERIMLEIVLGKPPARPDTPEEAEKRARLTAQCDEIKRKGGIIEIPSEIP